MKYLSNVIPLDFVLKIKFDRDFILKTMQKKSEYLRGFLTTSGYTNIHTHTEKETDREGKRQTHTYRNRG